MRNKDVRRTRVAEGFARFFLYLLLEFVYKKRTIPQAASRLASPLIRGD